MALAADDDAKPKPKPNPSMTVKLMVNKKNRRIMYAEAGKDFVDLLFSFLIIPTGAIGKQVALRSTDPTTKPSCINNLYISVEAFPDSLMKADKSGLLSPEVFSANYTNDMLDIQAPPPAKPAEPPKYYVCWNAGSSNYKHNLSTQSGVVICPCGYWVNREVNFVDGSPNSTGQPAPGPAQGFVKKRANFVITDDLNVIPVNSTATIVNLWNKIQVKDPTELEERIVTVGASEVIGLLKAALVSNTALNDVFKAEKKLMISLNTPHLQERVQIGVASTISFVEELTQGIPIDFGFTPCVMYTRGTRMLRNISPSYHIPSTSHASASPAHTPKKKSMEELER